MCDLYSMTSKQGAAAQGIRAIYAMLKAHFA
jgi:hypothetical protein